jgi:phage-related protein
MIDGLRQLPEEETRQIGYALQKLTEMLDVQDSEKILDKEKFNL